MISPPGVRRFTVTESREVMEVRADNLAEVAAWCGGEAHLGSIPGTGMVVFRAFGQDRAAHPGDVVIRLGDRSFWPMPGEEFERDLLPGWTEETT